MNMNGNELWIGLAAGLLPYRVERRWLARGGQRLHVRALFWSVVVRQHCNGRRTWLVHVPLIERLRNAAWAAIEQLRK
jgi:hypothetical protein